MLDHRCHVQFDGFVDAGRDLFNAVARRDTTREVGYVRTEVLSGILNDDRVGAHRDLLPRPACLTMRASVDFESSMPGAPGTVTDPFLLSCRNSRWLPDYLT